MNIKNREELNKWMNNCIQNDQNMFAIKGKPPEGACYDDGDPIVNDINIGWVSSTGDKFYIEYK